MFRRVIYQQVVLPIKLADCIEIALVCECIKLLYISDLHFLVCLVVSCHVVVVIACLQLLSVSKL